MLIRQYFVSILRIVLLTNILGILCGCSGYFYLTIESLDKKNEEISSVIPEATPIADEIPLEILSLNVKNIFSSSAQLEWIIPDLNLQTKIVFVQGNLAPENCSVTQVDGQFTVLGNTYSLTNLNPETIYSGRICSVSSSEIYSAGVTFQFKTLIHVNLDHIYSSFKNWNDYLENDGTNVFSASGTPCSLDFQKKYNHCLHGGQLFSATLPTGYLCSQLKIEDELEIFQWRCIDGVNPKIISMNLKDNKGLKDLISGLTFKSNFIKISTNNNLIITSEPSIWWDNTIKDLPVISEGTSKILTNEVAGVGTIYTYSENRKSGSIILSEDKISLVGLNNSTLKLGDNPIGPIISVPGAMLNNIKHIWIEGIYEGGNIYLYYVHNSRLNQVKVQNGYIFLDWFNSSVISNFSVSNLITSYGLYIDNSNSLEVYNGKLSNLNSGVSFNNTCLNNLVSNILVSNVSENGIGYFENSILSRISLVNMENSANGRSIRLANTGGIFSNLIRNYLGLNTLNDISSFNTENLTILNIASGAASSHNYYSSSEGGNNRFTGKILLQNSPSCSVVNSALAGLNGSCVPTGISDGVLDNTLDPNEVFKGPISIDDLQNLSDLNGSQLFSQIFDWLNFDSQYKLWSKPTTLLPDLTARGPCSFGVCEIWDYSLKPSSSNKAYNNTHINGTYNSQFIPGQTCPQAINGNEVTTALVPLNNSFASGNSTFLTHAEELAGDYIGDDDLLCESNEACLYLPNFGAYQGEGDYYSSGTCIFQNGTIQNVNMYAYPVN